jgi:hypothetical protein
MAPEVSLLRSQEHDSCPYTEPGEYSQRHPFISLERF